MLRIFSSICQHCRLDINVKKSSALSVIASFFAVLSVCICPLKKEIKYLFLTYGKYFVHYNSITPSEKEIYNKLIIRIFPLDFKISLRQN